MKINTLYQTKRPLISFEIFPPKRDGHKAQIFDTISALSFFKPDFISITYGAAGSKSNMDTVHIAKSIKDNYNINAMAHLTAMGSSQAQIDSVLEQLLRFQVENLLLLRGDTNANVDIDNRAFRYASDLIGYVNANYDFAIGAACYPEAHIDAKSRTLDLINLKKKVDAGTDFLVSQFFLDNELFYDFLYEARSLDIDIPVFPGVMPVLNKKQMDKMIALSGVSLPARFKKIMNRYENNPVALADAGIAYATGQIVDLLASGVDGIHVYVMNKPEVARKIITSISSILSDVDYQSEVGS